MTDHIEFYEEKNGFGEFQRLGPYSTKERRVYRFAELHQPEVEKVLGQARSMYMALSMAYLKKHGDVGTCVLGNGLYIAVKPPRARSAFMLRIAGAMGQSESPGYACKDAVLKFLKDNGIDAWYECGRMD